MRIDIAIWMSYEDFKKAYGNLIETSDAEAKEKQLSELYAKHVPAKEYPKRSRKQIED